MGESAFPHPTPPGCLPALRELCDKHGFLLVLDEVQSGMGRTGKMFASEHFGLKPDIMSIAKGIASGLPLGVTAAFNMNLLVRINRELHGNFELRWFSHRAIWNADQQRIEMHLVARKPHVVTIPDADSVVSFRREEWIWTESSYKYTPDQIVDMGAESNFAASEQWIDDDAKFALTLFTAM